MRANPYDLDRIGATDGAEVTVRSSHATVVAALRGGRRRHQGHRRAWGSTSTPRASRTAWRRRLMDPDAVVTEVRMESR